MIRKKYTRADIDETLLAQPFVAIDAHRCCREDTDTADPLRLKTERRGSGALQSTGCYERYRSDPTPEKKNK